MKFRLAVMEDLPQLVVVFEEIIQNMNRNQIQIWDEVYPCGFFEEDIKNKQLYVLYDSEEIVAAFALCRENAGANMVEWKNNQANALYLDRFGVNVNYLRMGMGSLAIQKAKETAKSVGAVYLRLFVVDINSPAIELYQKLGFIRAGGSYDEVIEDDFVLHEYGYEIEL